MIGGLPCHTSPNLITRYHHRYKQTHMATQHAQASIEMFEEPMDAPLWQLVALAAGTGGSMLAVGSVAGAADAQNLQVFSWQNFSCTRRLGHM